MNRLFLFFVSCIFIGVIGCDDNSGGGSGTCTPVCTDKACGDDGCGGSCGECTGATTCQSHQCVPSGSCQPSCKDKKCGDDGCGGSCGQCSGKMICQNHRCVPSDTCKPSCKNKKCGDDGCGGSCGQCKGSEICEKNQCIDHLTCVPACGGRKCGDDGCGGSCGQCAEDEECHPARFICRKSGKYLLKGRLMIQRALPYRDSDWQYHLKNEDKADYPVPHLPFIVIDGEGNNIHSGKTDEEGRFKVAFKQPTERDYQILFHASWMPDGHNRPVLAVYRPTIGTEGTIKKSEMWTWIFAVKDFADEGSGEMGDLSVRIEDGSGAIYLFDYLLRAMKMLTARFEHGDIQNIPYLPVVWNDGIKWQCGSCYYSSPLDLNIALTNGGKAPAHKVMLIGGEVGSESAWGYPTIFHEFGHYAMALTHDLPGGQHFVNAAIDPKLAWSEGWANFYSVMSMTLHEGKNSPIFWRILKNGAFWQDYAQALGVPAFNRPSLTEPMSQKISESWIAHMLYGMWDVQSEIPAIPNINNDLNFPLSHFFAALKSERYINLDYNRGAYGRDFVDFVDAMICRYPDDGQRKDMLKKFTDFLYKQVFPYRGDARCIK